jgi:1-acyl-sn-glycerol-3-phosphate acyltransferase
MLMEKSDIVAYILLPFRVLYKVYYLFVFVISLMVTYPLMRFLLKKPKRFTIAFKVMRIHAFFLLVFAGVKLQVRGREHIPQTGPFLICPNHSSFLDIFCLYSVFHSYFVFVGKKEIENWPLFHIYYTSGMNILVDRANTTGSLKSFKQMAQVLKEGKALAIFPEGTISKKAPVLMPFKQGAFSLAIQRGVPILPITFKSNWKRLQRASFWWGKAGPGLSKMVIHPLIQSKGFNKEDVGQLTSNVKEIIESALDGI